jgi:hypothetical protein
VICPLCGTRRARRGCPALDKQICAVCCGTKRLVEIQCPSDCPYLGNAREHPPAAVVRQQQRDMGVLAQFMRDFNERQSQLFFLIATFLARYQPPELQPLIDDDVREAAAALAATSRPLARRYLRGIDRPGCLPRGWQTLKPPRPKRRGLDRRSNAMPVVQRRVKTLHATPARSN